MTVSWKLPGGGESEWKPREELPLRLACAMTAAITSFQFIYCPPEPIGQRHFDLQFSRSIDLAGAAASLRAMSKLAHAHALLQRRLPVLRRPSFHEDSSRELAHSSVQAF